MATQHRHINLTKTGIVAIVAFGLTVFSALNPVFATNIAGSLLGGILPALFWLWFWLHEDHVHPEPKRIIFSAFFLGMVSVPLAILLEKIYIGMQYPGTADVNAIAALTIFDLLVWAMIEEFLKYGMAFLAAFQGDYFDEPIDAVMYMISVALGFAALENALFIWSALDSGAISEGLLTGQLRFIGASLLHVASSALIGFGIGFGLCKHHFKKAWYLSLGLASSFALHTVFNYLIIISDKDHLLEVFALLWIVMILIIFLFERIKRSPCYRPSVQ